MNTIRNAIDTIWNSTLGRLAILAGAFGWVPFYLLSTAHASLAG